MDYQAQDLKKVRICSLQWNLLSFPHTQRFMSPKETNNWIRDMKACKCVQGLRIRVRV